MAKTHSLQAEDRKRTGTGVLKEMRREGFIPSVIYGNGFENRKVKVNSKQFRDLVSHTASTNILVDLQLDGGESQLALVRELQHDPLSGAVLHADFLAVKADSAITAQLPVELVGEAIGVKLGGQLEQMLHTVEIECLPKDLPELIEADISELDVGNLLHIGDVKWPEGVSPTIGSDVVVALVAKTRVALSEAAQGEEGAEAAVAGPAE